MMNRNKNFFTDKIKGLFALGALAFVVIWLVLWWIFPMEWYAFFFNNAIGSNLQLVLLACVLSMPMCFIFSKITKNDIPFVKTLIANVLCLVLLDHIYAIYYTTDFAFIVTIVHFVVSLFLFGTAKSKDGKSVINPIKRQPILTILWAVIYTLILDFADILLLRLITFTFYN